MKSQNSINLFAQFILIFVVLSWASSFYSCNDNINPNFDNLEIEKRSYLKACGCKIFILDACCVRVRCTEADTTIIAMGVDSCLGGSTGYVFDTIFRDTLQSLCSPWGGRVRIRIHTLDNTDTANSFRCTENNLFYTDLANLGLCDRDTCPN